MSIVPEGNDPLVEVDLQADLHGLVAEFVSDEARQWFEKHPGVDIDHRPAVDHEFCDPRTAPACRPLPSGVQGKLWVEVRQIVPGFRTRAPYLVLDGGEAA